MAKVQRKKPTRKPSRVDGTAEDALVDLMRSLKKWAEQVGAQQPPDYVLLALGELAHHVTGVDEAGPEDDQAKRLASAAGREETGVSQSRPAAPRDHDGKDGPSGFRYSKAIGRLIATGPARMRLKDGRVQWLTEVADRDQLIAAKLRKTLDVWESSGMLGDRRTALEAAYKGMFGLAFGEEWRLRLVVQLEHDARMREENRLAGEHGKDTVQELLSDAELLARVRGGGKHLEFGPGCALPDRLTAAAVAQMRKLVTVNGRGRGGGRKATSVVNDFATAVTRRNSSK